ncbi:MAG: UvrD-helicase domain-containing protein [Actinomycetota bacterium]
MSTRELADESVRRLVRRRGLGETLFVEAGAGTGKTTLLVDRIVNLVLHGGVSLRSIAAITFTEAAAAELQTRVRAAFEKAEAKARKANQFDEAERCAAAIEESDLAAITTLHGFANRILGEFSVGAGLPPRVRVLDEVSSQLAHEDRWQRFVDALYDDLAHEQLLITATSLDIALEPRYPGHTTLRDVAVEFNQNWDRLEPVRARAGGVLPPMDFAPFDDAVAHLAGWIPECVDPADKLLHHLRRIVPEMQAIVDIDDDHRKLRLLANKRREKGWGKSRGGGKLGWDGRKDQVKDDIVAVNEAIGVALEPIVDQVLLKLAALVADETVAAATARRDEGGLEFHDLLVLARNLLRTNPEARRSLHDRYTHLLLDEFQDTDPIQIELAVLIATSAADVTDCGWSDLAVEPGRLFFVGDPKQSIYRFRRADIGLFLRARDRFAGEGGAHQLTTNFRTVEPIVEWVNALFGSVMAEEKPERQPQYMALHANRDGDQDIDTRHRPILLGGPHENPKIRSAELRAVEADDVVRAIRAILDSPDEFPIVPSGKRKPRRPRLGDITVLLPTRTSLPFLKAALDDASISYRIATGTLVYDTQEVVDALAAIRSIDDPADAISLVTALRSPLYACSDVDLFMWKRAGGRWDIRSSRPDTIGADHPVALAFEHLHALWREGWFLTPSALLERLLRERKAAMLAFGASRPTDVWRRLRFLVEQARAFEESSPGGLRAFTEWAALQSGSMARVHEPLLPETDEDAISIQTIHGSKGLEFPITILSGMTTLMQRNRPGVSVLWHDVEPPEIRIRGGTETMRHEPRADLESEMDEYERMRLAYVAATRARDHLIVSCHHHQRQTEKTYGGIFWQAFQDDRSALVRDVDLDELVDDRPSAPPPPAQLGLALDARNEWRARREALLDRFRETRVLSATGVAKAALQAEADESTPAIDGMAGSAGDSGPVEQDDDRADQPDEGVVERRKGRIGSAIGSAVHGALELVDLGNPATGGALDEIVAQQAHAFSIPQHAFVVGQLVRAALESDAVALAAQHTHHKELFVAAPLDDRIVEGYVDLLIEGTSGLIVVDYKTDSIRSEADIDAKLHTYELQAAAYAVALEQATDQPIAECRFVFLKSGGAIERSVRDLPEAMARVRQTVRLARLA